MKFTTKKALIILGALIIVGFYLRFVLISKTDFWFDEAYSGIEVRGSWAEMLNIFINDKIQGPLYYLLLRGWGAIAGYDYQAIRFFSLIWGVLLIPATYIFGTLLSTDKLKKQLIGLTGAALISLSPYFIAYSVEARGYSILMLFGALSAITFIKAVTLSPKKLNRYWVATFIFLAFTMVTHYLSMIYIAMLLLSYAIYILIERGTFNKARFWQAGIPIVLTAYLLMILIANTPFVKKYIDLINGRMWWIAPSNLNTAIQSFYAFLFGVDRQANLVPPVYKLSFGIDPLIIAYLILVVVIISVVIYINAHKNEPKKLFIISYLTLLGFISLCLISLLSALGINIYVERYLSIYGWYMIMLLAFLSIEVWGNKAIFAAVVYLILAGSVVLPPTSHPFSQTRDFIQNQIKPKHVFVCDVGGDFVILHYYLDQYQKTTYMYSPENYDSFNKVAIIKAAGVVKDFTTKEPGDVFVCGERRDDTNRTLINQIEWLSIYKFN